MAVAVISTAIMLSPDIPGEVHFLVGGAYFALASAMACRVFPSQENLTRALVGSHQSPAMHMGMVAVPCQSI